MPGKHFPENILRKVFLGDATREMGTHDALLAADGAYARLYHAQMKAAEEAAANA